MTQPRRLRPRGPVRRLRGVSDAPAAPPTAAAPASAAPASAAPASAAVDGGITREEVARVAHLSRLTLSKQELRDFTPQLAGILRYVALLDEVETDGVEPMAHAIELRDVLREDAVTPMLPRTAALANAPETDGEFFLVPQILGGD